MAAMRLFPCISVLERQLTNLWNSSRQTGQDVGKWTVRGAATTKNPEAIYKCIAHKRAQHSTAYHSTAQHSTTQHSTAQHNTA